MSNVVYGSQTNKVDTDGGAYTGTIDVLHQAVHLKKCTRYLIQN